MSLPDFKTYFKASYQGRGFGARETNRSVKQNSPEILHIYIKLIFTKMQSHFSRESVVLPTNGAGTGDTYLPSLLYYIQNLTSTS